MRSVLGAALAISLGAACFDPSLDGALECSPQGLCPPGTFCALDRICRSSPADDDAGAIDGSAMLGPFGTPALIAEIPSFAADPDLSTDGLELFFRVGNDDNDPDLAVARRASVDQPWLAAEMIDELSTSVGEFDPRVSADGLTLWFTRGTINTSSLLVATRASTASSWAAGQPIVELQDSGATFSFAVTADGSHAVFSSTRDGGVDLYTTERIAGAWARISLADELNSNEFDGSADLSPDGLTVYFDSDRSGPRQLYRATRAATNTPFFPPQPVAELSSPSDDEDPSISADGRTLIFSSGLDGGRRLYQATR